MFVVDFEPFEVCALINRPFINLQSICQSLSGMHPNFEVTLLHNQTGVAGFTSVTFRQRNEQ